MPRWSLPGHGADMPLHAAALAYLDEVARSGSIRQAARRLNIAASTVNCQILKIEVEFDTLLFERLPSGLRLTPAGELVVRHARATLHEYGRMRAELDALDGIRSGLVRIATLDSLLLRVVPELLMPYVRANPDVRYAVNACGPGEIVRRVAAGDADIGIAFDLEEHSAMRVESLVEMPIRAMVARDHPLAAREHTTLLECASYPMLFQEDTQPIGSLLLHELEEARMAATPLMASNNLTLIKQLICAGLGVAFFTAIGFLDELADGRVVGVPLLEPRLNSLNIVVITARSRHLAPATNDLVQLISTALAGLANHYNGH